MFRVVAQINSGDPCPKKEYRAWTREVKECITLEECILFLIENQAKGFEIVKHLEGEEEIVARERVFHYPIYFED